MRPSLSIVLLLLTLALPAHADTVAEVSSPDGTLKVEVDVNGEGRLGYSVSRKGEPLIGYSRLGFNLRNGREFLRGLKLDTKAARSFDETWEQPWGERRFVRNRYNELRASFVESDRDHRRLDVVFRVFDDGVGFRYEFPKQPKLDEVQVQQELTEFAIAQPATAGMNLAKGEGGRLRASLTPGSVANVVRRVPFATPWRTIQVADRAGGLVESNLILNLNEPNRLGDVSWFKPHKYVGVWWSLHLDTETWGTGPKHGATTENTKRYIDFAAKHGFRGVLVEGWNVGWDGDWFANGWNFDFSKPTPDYDLEGLAAYAKSKGVHLIGHHETACAVSHYERQMEDAFALFQRLGIDAIKTGYVCDAGQIERQDATNGPVVREWHEGQFMSNHHQRVLEAAAQARIAINSHEPIKDTGLRRTYPNWVSREGARGQEFNAWGNPPNPPEHEANLVFTRMLAGPMDFTPGVLTLKGRGGQPIPSTKAKQLALYVVLYSPIHMAADLPEHYEQHMDGFQFIKDVPTDWQDTRVINGEVGDFVTIARKDRNSEDWYVGSVTDEEARTLEVPLEFLDAKRTYTAQVYRDGDGADWKTNPFAFVREERTVKRGDTLTLKLGSGGGAAIRFVAK